MFEAVYSFPLDRLAYSAAIGNDIKFLSLSLVMCTTIAE